MKPKREFDSQPRSLLDTPWFFRQRKFLPIPFIVVGLAELLRRGHPFQRETWLRIWLDCLAWGLILGGESIRIWAVGYIGRKSRSSDIHATRLMTSGPYAHTRNPLYFGGFLLTMGLSLLTGSPWIVLGCLAYWAIVYGPIIRAEEQFLQHTFGRTYRAYHRMVPRWWPRLWPAPGVRRTRWHWPELEKEYQTISAIVAVALLIHLSLLGSDWLHGRWKPHWPA
ncbi:MAG: isoprenylcysteine carboxylmethyltransferase family protein [Candidatus Omnitrophica bacterium]|nr:isoprenylcysteine carboxylmethyltransferase family protein [Candidatus Omnitrophota bacterium]